MHMLLLDWVQFLQGRRGGPTPTYQLLLLLLLRLQSSSVLVHPQPSTLTLNAPQLVLSAWYTICQCKHARIEILDARYTYIQNEKPTDPCYYSISIGTDVVGNEETRIF